MANEEVFLTFERIQSLYKEFQKIDTDNDGFISLKSLKEDMEEDNEETFSKRLEGVTKFIKINAELGDTKKLEENPVQLMDFVENTMKSKEESGLSLNQLNKVLDKFTKGNGNEFGFTPLTDDEIFINFKGTLQVIVNCARLQFQEIDKDQNGLITRRELQEFLKKEIPLDGSSDDDDSDVEAKNNFMSKKAAKMWIAGCDQNGDGELNFKEFFEGLERLERDPYSN